MVKEKQDFPVYSKNHLVLSVSIVDNDTSESVDLSDFPEILWFAAERPSSEYIITKSIGHGITKTDAANGVFTIELSSSDLASHSGSFYHEAVMVDVASESYTVMVGTMKVKKSAYDR